MLAGTQLFHQLQQGHGRPLGIVVLRVVGADHLSVHHLDAAAFQFLPFNAAGVAAMTAVQPELGM